MIKLFAIAPVVESEAIGALRYQQFLDEGFGNRPDITVTGRLLELGPTAIENEIDDALSVPGVLRAGLRARADGADGILIDCMLDPGLKALRCALEIPVVGAAEVSFRLAGVLGHRFGVVDVCDDTAPMVGAQMRALGLGERFTGVRSTGLSVHEISRSDALTAQKLFEAALLSIDQDGADVIVLGCTEFSRHAGELHRRLVGRAFDVPVINPTTLALGTLEALVRARLCHSKRAYPTPKSRKSQRGFALPELYDPS